MALQRRTFSEECAPGKAGEPSKERADFELQREVLDMGRTINPFMHSGLVGETYAHTYLHKNGTAIIVTQTNILEHSPYRLDAQNGWYQRKFVFGGEPAKIKRLVEKLSRLGTKLKSDEPISKPHI